MRGGVGEVAEWGDASELVATLGAVLDAHLSELEPIIRS
jgi:hypothetical protein